MDVENEKAAEGCRRNPVSNAFTFSGLNDSLPMIKIWPVGARSCTSTSNGVGERIAREPANHHIALSLMCQARRTSGRGFHPEYESRSPFRPNVRSQSRARLIVSCRNTFASVSVRAWGSNTRVDEF